MNSANADAKLRLRRVIDRSNQLLTDSAGRNEKRLTGHPRVSGRDRVITYRLQVHGSIVDPSWEFDLAEILLNTRSLLDNLMWNLAHEDTSIEYSEKEERYITFPIVETEAAWDAAVRTKAHLRRLNPSVLARVRAMQPIDTDERPDEVLSWVDALHRVDKHRDRLRIVAGLDTQWPMFFRLVGAGQGEVRQSIDWLISPSDPLRSNIDVVRVTCSGAVKAPPVEKIPCALFVVVDGEKYDLQDFVWDLQALAMKAYEVLLGLEPDMFKGLRALAEYRRERLAAFNRSMVDGTDEWALRFGGDDPVEALMNPS